LDIGANLGQYTCLIAKCRNDVTVVAFEPHPIVIKELEKNVHLNGLQNVIVVNTALSDTDGVALFDPVYLDRPTPHGRVHSAEEPELPGKVKIKCARGESIVRDGSIPQPQIV